MLNKPVNMLLYLAACTALFFYMPKIIAAINKPDNPNQAGNTIDQDAYYALREAAALHLGQITVSYNTDPITGLCQPQFQNTVCPTPNADPTILQKQQQSRRNELHKLIKSWEPCVDTDNSGFIDLNEGAIFRDLYEFGELLKHGFNGETKTPAELAKATGKTENEITELLEQYQVMKACWE